MRITGKRIPEVHRYETDWLRIELDIELVIPDADPSEPCYEVETLKFIREMEIRALNNDLCWLSENGCRVTNKSTKPDVVAQSLRATG